MNPTALTYIKHYLWAIMATALNGGIAAVVAVIAHHDPLTLATLWPCFKVAAFISAVMYMSAHPLPLPDATGVLKAHRPSSTT